MMNVVIIDDEPKAIELLRGYLARYENLKLIGAFRNSLTALEFVENHPIDLILLDINMPHLSGLAFAKAMKSDAKVIFTTAHAEYAAESYDIEALDYILKPILFERLAKAIRKASQHVPSTNHLASIFIKSGNHKQKVNPHEILFLEKNGNYISFHFAQSKILARYSIAETLALLPDYFIQVHKSYIVNKERIESIHKDELLIAKRSVPIGQSFKENILSKLNS